jgi:hypothetical protein
MRTASLLAVAALLIALLAAGVLTFADTSSSTSCEGTSSGVQTCTDASSTLIQENGSWVLALLAVPVLLAAGVVAAIAYKLPPPVEWILALAAFAACIVAIFSVGIFFLPTALLLVVAAAKDHRSTLAS